MIFSSKYEVEIFQFFDPRTQSPPKFFSTYRWWEFRKSDFQLKI
jgi:hypothetical protein